MEHKGRLLSRIVRVVVEEVAPVLSRQALVHVAAGLPASSFATTRTALLRAAGVKIGPRSLIQGPVRLTGHGNPCELLTIGEFTLITGGLHADLGASVHIGDHVRIGHDVSLLTINHQVGTSELRAGYSFVDPIVIENGCWLASRCTILPGVVIGSGAIVAAGAVVSRNVPKNTLVAGVPARVIRELPEDGTDRPLEALESIPPPSSGRGGSA